MKGPSSPYNREPLWETNYSTHTPLYNTTATLNKLRNHAIRQDKHYVSKHSSELYLDGSTYVTRKGSGGSQIVSVFSNQGSRGGPYELTVPAAFKPGTEAIDVLSCNRVTADDEGKLTIEMDAGRPKAFFPAKKMGGSGLCGFRKHKAKAPLCTAPGKGKGKGKGKGNSTETNHTAGGDTPEQASSGSVAAMSYSMILMGVFAGVANWLL